MHSNRQILLGEGTWGLSESLRGTYLDSFKKLIFTVETFSTVSKTRAQQSRNSLSWLFLAVTSLPFDLIQKFNFVARIWDLGCVRRDVSDDSDFSPFDFFDNRFFADCVQIRCGFCILKAILFRIIITCFWLVVLLGKKWWTLEYQLCQMKVLC